MAKFKYYQDKKVEIWERTSFEIEAETQEEADAKAIEDFEYEEYPEGESMVLYDTMEEISVEENDGQLTREIFRAETDEQIHHNAQKEEVKVEESYS